VIVTDCTEANWRQLERFLINGFRERGKILFNVADGGDEPHCPIEVRRANGRKTMAKRLRDYYSVAPEAFPNWKPPAA
jgi:hypothetical protein